jgi:hypothetical protein
MHGVGVMYGPRGEEFAVLYRLWRSTVLDQESWGGTFAILTPSAFEPGSGTYRLFLEDKVEREVMVWEVSGGAVGRFVGYDEALELQPAAAVHA